MSRIQKEEGRRLFGADPGGYDRVRPPYPDWVFQSLRDTGALFTGAATLEIGPGSGLATRQLLAAGAAPMTLVEPDERLAEWLSAQLSSDTTPRSRADSVQMIVASFEAAPLKEAQFDLVVAATAFHWLDGPTALEKIRSILKPGASLALMWNVFQQLGEVDEFHEATLSLLSPLARSPSGAPDTIPYALDHERRTTELRIAGFDQISYEQSQWSYRINATQVGELYGGFSQIQRLPESERDRLLDELVEIAASRFGGEVTRNMTTCLYHCRRP